ncbi:MAG: hypothetical protein ACRDN9_18380, partial [Streptosporangiaceae bacterium]
MHPYMSEKIVQERVATMIEVADRERAARLARGGRHGRRPTGPARRRGAVTGAVRSFAAGLGRRRAAGRHP